MFGFGMSDIDKTILNVAEQMLSPYAAAGINIRSLAKKFFDESKAELLHDHRHDGRHAWRNLYREDLGELLIKNPLYFAPRKAAGLTEQDIKEYWNRPAILVSIGVRINYFLKFVALDIARQQGKDLEEFARTRRRNGPIFGEPTLWDQSLAVNQGFSQEDADLYLEFLPRVVQFEQTLTADDRQQLVQSHRSFNAMIRELVKQSKV